MEEEDDTQSHQSPGSPAASDSPVNEKAIVTVAASTLVSVPAAVVPIQMQSGGGEKQRNGGGGGGREDCWSESSTAVLIDAWGERYLELSRGNLKQKHWKEVADIVSSREDYKKTPKTDIQCKNRIDTVKKKYKLEKAKMMSGGGTSKWVFFDKLDQLIGPTAKIPVVASAAGGGGGSGGLRVPVGIPVGIRSQIGKGSSVGGSGGGSGSMQKIHLRKRIGGPIVVPPVDSDEEESDEDSRDSLDSFPPEKRPRGLLMGNSSKGKKDKDKEKEKGSGNGGWGDSLKMLTQAIMKFGEAYEQAENAKIQQVMEMEKQRMKFMKELELQRMQFFMKTQMEISQLKHGGRRAGGGNASNHHNHHHHRSNDNGNDNNNSDSDN